MSIKSLLQLILLLLIFLIIGAIYYLYFYSKPLSEINIVDNNLEKLGTNKLIDTSDNDQDILENINVSNLETDKKDEVQNVIKKEVSLNKNKLDNNLNEKNMINKSVQDKTENEIKNLTQEIEYITTNKNGDTFKIIAKYGKTNIEDSNILDLEKVEGKITSDIRSSIYIISDYAKYNYSNQNSKFYGNVKVKYDGRIITCNNLDLIISDNIAIAYNNVIVKDNKSVMKAQKVTLNTITKDININSDEQIKILAN